MQPISVFIHFVLKSLLFLRTFAVYNAKIALQIQVYSIYTMMKKALSVIAFTMLFQWASAIKILSGPYIQNVTETSCDIFWRTDKPSTAWVELAPDDGTHFYFKERPRTYATDLGRAVVGTLHHVTLKDLTPGTPYRYRIYSQEVLRQQPYHVDYGEMAASDVFRSVPPKFTTLSPGKDTVEFLVLNDIHSRNDLLEDLLGNVGKDNTDFVLYNGDMVNFMDNEEDLFSGFIDTSAKRFAAEKPFVMARGNHETRGTIAKDFMRYFPSTTGKPYYSFRYGPCFFIVLDAGEDKPDSDIEYSGTSFFDDYRKEEARWLDETLQSDACREAPFKMVIMHVPLSNATWHGEVHARECFLPLLNQAGIDLMLCGHIHSYAYYPKGHQGADFPVLQNSNEESVRIKVDKTALDMQVLNRKGESLHKFRFGK